MTYRVFIVMKDDRINDIEVSSVQKVFYTQQKAQEFIDTKNDEGYWIMEEQIF